MRLLKGKPESFDFNIDDIEEYEVTDIVIDTDRINEDGWTCKVYRIEDCDGNEGTLIFIDNVTVEELKMLSKKPKSTKKKK